MLSNDNTPEFLDYMNQVFIGKQGAPFITGGVLPRVTLGDKGYNTSYRDYSPEQSRHFWAFVNYGANYGSTVAKKANILHEVIEPVFSNLFSSQAKGSKADFELSDAAIKVGQLLKENKITPLDFSEKLDSILRTKSYKAGRSKLVDTTIDYLINESHQVMDAENSLKNRTQQSCSIRYGD